MKFVINRKDGDQHLGYLVVLHPGNGPRCKWNFPQLMVGFVDDGDWTGVVARRVTSPTFPAQHIAPRGL